MCVGVCGDRTIVRSLQESIEPHVAGLTDLETDPARGRSIPACRLRLSHHARSVFEARDDYEEEN